MSREKPDRLLTEIRQSQEKLHGLDKLRDAHLRGLMRGVGAIAAGNTLSLTATTLPESPWKYALLYGGLGLSALGLGAAGVEYMHTQDTSELVKDAAYHLGIQQTLYAQKNSGAIPDVFDDPTDQWPVHTPEEIPQLETSKRMQG